MANLTVIPRSNSSEQKDLIYSLCDWGDRISGSKAQLQALGIGLQAVFPGEPGGAKRSMRTTDQRGFPVEVQKDERYGFCALVWFPGWPRNPRFSYQKTEVCAGVTRHEEYWNDVYTGSAENLVAAGLVKADQFPGLPGMRKVCVSIRADGSVVDGPPNANHGHQMGEGSKRVLRAGKKFEVKVRILDVEAEQRQAALDARESEWRRLIKSLPRPARLDLLHAPKRADAPLQRGHLRLVWSQE